MPVQEIDWEAIKADYLAGMSQAQLGEKYRMPKGTIATRCAKEKWNRIRKATAQKATAKLIEKASTKIAGDRAKKLATMISANDGMARVLDRITRQLDALEDAPIKNLRDMSDLAKAISMTADTMLKLYGMPTQHQEHAQWLAEQRLKMDQERLELDRLRADTAQGEGENIEIRIITPEEADEEQSDEQ